MTEVPAELTGLLRSDPMTAHIATCRDGRPHVAPVWYLNDDGSVWLATSGRKLADIRTNPYVSLLIEKSERGSPERTATL
jgi:nitroimidazol reductase NimA-like FMN-containing flavoprotein (pyridoxamine 5'-phosphate oxidase superfamily)